MNNNATEVQKGDLTEQLYDSNGTPSSENTLVTAAAAMVPQSLKELERFSLLLAKSNIIPNDYRGKPADVMVAVLYGLEVQLKPLQALQNIAVIGGRPSIFGDAAIAIVRSSPLCEYIRETFDEHTMTATCKVKRVGQKEEIRTFTQEDAKTAKLWGKKGPWTEYPKRMLQMRARSFALRDVFPDLLKGIILYEEAIDIPTKGKKPPMEDAEWKEEAPGSDFEEKEPAVTNAELKAMGIAFTNYGKKDRKDRLDYCAGIIGREIESSKDLTRKEYDDVMEALKKDIASKEAAKAEDEPADQTEDEPATQADDVDFTEYEDELPFGKE